MKKIALTAAILTVLSGPTFAQAGYEMLENNVANELRRVVPDADLSKVTLGDLVLIKSILDGNDSENQQKSRIQYIIDEAAAKSN